MGQEAQPQHWQTFMHLQNQGGPKGQQEAAANKAPNKRSIFNLLPRCKEL